MVSFTINQAMSGSGEGNLSPLTFFHEKATLGGSFSFAEAIYQRPVAHFVMRPAATTSFKTLTTLIAIFPNLYALASSHSV